MKNVKVAFHILHNGKKAPNGYHYVNCHMLFNVKIEDFRRKACLVVGGHVVENLSIITYPRMVTRETECIATSMTTLHDQEVKAANVLNAYTTVPNKKTIWMVLGLEFGNDASESFIIDRAAYQLNSVCASFRAHLKLSMQELGYESHKTKPHLLWKPDIRPQDKFMNYLYILSYADDIVSIIPMMCRTG